MQRSQIETIGKPTYSHISVGDKIMVSQELKDALTAYYVAPEEANIQNITERMAMASVVVQAMNKASRVDERMGDAVDVAERAKQEIEDLLAEMFEGQWPDNKILLGTLTGENSSEQIQVQLLLTRNHNSFMDEQ